MKRLGLLSAGLAVLWAALAGQAPAARVVFLTDEAPAVVPAAEDGAWRSVLRLLVRERDGSMEMGCGVWTVNGAYTAWHVVMDAQSVTVVGPDGDQHVAWGWWRLGAQDAALVRLEAPLSLPAVRVAPGPVAESGSVRACAYWGFGLNSGRYVTATGFLDVTEGRTPANIGARFYGTNIPAERGMSGSPLLAGDLLIGVLSHRVEPPRASFYAPVDAVSAPLEPGKYQRAPQGKAAPEPFQRAMPAPQNKAGKDCKT